MKTMIVVNVEAEFASAIFFIREAISSLQDFLRPPFSSKRLSKATMPLSIIMPKQRVTPAMEITFKLFPNANKTRNVNKALIGIADAAKSAILADLKKINVRTNAAPIPIRALKKRFFKL